MYRVLTSGNTVGCAQLTALRRVFCNKDRHRLGICSQSVGLHESQVSQAKFLKFLKSLGSLQSTKA